MTNILIAIIVAAIVIVAAAYILREKKKGAKCIGCPDACHCQKRLK